jgi:hypothetical protein
MVQHIHILSILPARTKLFSEVWLILSDNFSIVLLSFLFDQTGRSRAEAALV